ncbi:MAG TPA: low molecular weight phosphotyrosine protein phosphatase [Gammaproteobacteria bacterium]|nr:low molecular weight phosphotyrosine protein phosphatase [Gammaproteobacteria bacterium]
MVKVLFVCMGNICRSPTAHGVFRELVRQEGLEDAIQIDSAGTHAYHVGNPPDQRAQATARNRGIDLSDLRARQVNPEDFERFDYVLAMDEENLVILRELCPPGREERLRLFLDFAPQRPEREVPDPYYGGPQGFEHVFDLVEEAARGLLEDIRQRF